MEGAAGAGSPVAICGAMLVGLGVPPFKAAVICLIANTSPVCYGGLGVPVMTLETATGIPGDRISIMCGHQLPFLSFLIPLYMVKTMCTWRQTLAIWPALAVGGGSFALAQFFFATAHAYGFPPIWPLTDICGAIFSMAVLALFLKFVWKPKDEWKFPAEQVGAGQTPEPATPADPHQAEAQAQVASLLPSGQGMANRELPLTARRVLVAWSPWVIMALFLVVSGFLKQEEKKGPIDLGIADSYYAETVPTLHNEVERAYQLQKLAPTEGVAPAPGAPGELQTADGKPVQDGPRGKRLREREAAEFRFIWLTAPGTPVFLAALVSMLLLRVSWAQVGRVFRKTVYQMRIPIPTIGFMLGLSYVTKYAGMDATLGVAFAETGVLYPFFAAMLGWLGVFLTGTDAGSNALFGSLQKITATEVWNEHGDGAMSNLTLDQAQTLICTANSTGGVMGKMIDAQSICVATAGTTRSARGGHLQGGHLAQCVPGKRRWGDDGAPGVRVPVHLDGATLRAAEHHRYRVGSAACSPDRECGFRRGAGGGTRPVRGSAGTRSGSGGYSGNATHVRITTGVTSAFGFRSGRFPFSINPSHVCRTHNS